MNFTGVSGAFTWLSSTSDVRALKKAGNADRIASTWWAPSTFGIDVNVVDGTVHPVALYLLDWDNGGRSERIDVLDAVTGPYCIPGQPLASPAANTASGISAAT